MTDAAAIDACLARYTPEIRSQLVAARAHLAAHFAQGYELVYDTYNALGFGIAHGTKATDAVISVVGYPRWTTLFFLYGADLPDPHGILEGTGARVRSVRLAPFSRLESPEVQALIVHTKARYRAAFEAAPALSTRLKSQAAVQRPRQPAPSSGARWARR